MEYDDYDYGPNDEWFKTDERYRCRACGYVGPAEAKAVEEIQGDGVMTGSVMVATGDMRCPECESTELNECSEST
jgi:hypothetical protein